MSFTVSEVTAGLPALRPNPGAAAQPFPLTPTQQALWVGRADAIELGDVGCYGYFEWERGDLDLNRYRRAWERLVEYHPGLRTVVRPDGTQVVVSSPGPVPITVEDLREDPDVAQRLEQSRAEGSHRMLDPGVWPMFDLHVVLLPDRTRIQLGIDLQLMDASSLFLNLFPDLITLYEDPDAHLVPQRLTFRDFACWQSEDLRGAERWQADWEYWRERIEDLSPAPILPDGRHAGEELGQFERCTIRYSAEDFSVLRKRAAAYQVNETELLIGLFAEVLRGWSAEPEFTLNVPIFQRFDVPGIEEVIGDYTNAILLDVRPTGHSVAERIAGLAEQFRADIRHSSVNGVDVLREIARRRGTAAASMPVVVTSLLGLRPTRSITEFGAEVHSITQTPQVSLDFQIREEDEELRLVWDYRAGVFAPGVVSDAFEMFLDLMGRVLADEPGHGVWTEHHLDPRSRRDRTVWNAVNDTAQPVPDELLHERFFAQARQTPHAEAVVAPGRRLTYGELADHARRIGNGLRDRGLLPGQLVGVLMEKGWEQYAAVYGILSAGGAYLPLDVSTPPRRIARLLQSAEVSTILVQARLADSLDLPAESTVLRADIDFETASTEPLIPVQTADDPAYVIYTSGSTGDPKGVMVRHRGVVNLVTDVQRRFDVAPADRLLAISGLHFDASIYDVFGPLSCGATVVVPPPFRRAEPDVWVNLVRDERVTFWNSVPVLMELLVGEAETRADRPLDTLRLAVLSGDWIPLNLPDRARAQAATLKVVGSGGPTETICWSLFYPIGDLDPAWTTIPYGKPITNQRYYIVDRQLRPRPTWARGEIAVASSVGLAVGYHGDPERTEAKFVTLPRSGERAYLTGDFGRLLPDGNIEILGREDFQVKVAGQRIELGEVEAVLNRFDGVRAAVVTAPRSSAAVIRLQAFVVPEAGVELTADALRAHLSGELPAIMVPAMVTLLPELPLTANGKVDRLALTKEVAGSETPVEPVPDTGSGLLAQLIAACAGEVLGLGDVTEADNFFRLGGDSLSGTRLTARLQELLGASVPIRTVFGHPEISELAAVIAADPTIGPQSLRVAQMLHALEQPDDEPDGADKPAVQLDREDPELASMLASEEVRQQNTLALVASASVAPSSVLACAGSSLTNLTLEGYPGARYHGGGVVADRIERLAISRACTLFNARAANVQPHSGSSANLAVLMGLLEPGDTILGLDLDCGGHLTHGSAASITGRYFRSVGYRTGDDELLDYRQIAALAAEHQPKVIICGASAYPREIDFPRFREIADAVGAYLVADISHISGLVATGLHPSPVDHAHVTTTSTYKQLYGPRGGVILLGRDAESHGPDGRTPLRTVIDRAVFPLLQGTPDLGNVAAKARALQVAAQPAFQTLMKLVIDHAAVIAEQLQRRGLRVVTGGTDTHMVLVDLRPLGVTGAAAEEALEACGILVNRNRVPGDNTPPRVTAGIRIGTNTLAARAVPAETAALCADLIADLVEELHTSATATPSVLANIRAEVRRICADYPLLGNEGVEADEPTGPPPARAGWPSSLG